MALPSKITVQKLDIAYLGGPYCVVEAKGAEGRILDLAYLSLPIVVVGDYVSVDGVVLTSSTSIIAGAVTLSAEVAGITLDNSYGIIPGTASIAGDANGAVLNQLYEISSSGDAVGDTIVEGVLIELMVGVIPGEVITGSCYFFTPSNIVDGSLKLKKNGVRDIPTVVEVRYTDTSVVPWVERSAIAKRAGVDTGIIPRRESQISMPGIQRYSQAYREAVERLNHFTLEDLLVEWDSFDEGLELEVGDVVNITHPIGLSKKRVRLTSVSSNSPGRWHFTAREYDPATYTNMVVSSPTYADTTLPSASSPPALTNLTAVEEVYAQQTGTYSSRLKITWEAPDYPYVLYYRIEIYRLGKLINTATSRDTEYASPAVQERVEYVVKVSIVTTVGTVGEWKQTNITPQGKYLIPSNVPSIDAFEASGTIHASWEPAIDVDIWRYEIRYGAVGGSWSTALLVDRTDSLRLQTSTIPVGTWVLYVKALDSVGQYSTTAASVTVVVSSDAAAFLVDSYEQSNPTLTNMQSFTLAPSDPKRYYITEDTVAFGTKFSNNLDTYGDTLATYHSSLTSTWLGESEDFGLLLGGQWTGKSSVTDLSGSHTSYFGFSTNGSSWTYVSGLSQKYNARFARLKHEAATTSTLLVAAPDQNIRLDAVPRDENGSGTSNASGATTITLTNVYTAVKKLTITAEGTTARMAVYDNIVLGTSSSTFDVYVFNSSGAQIASNFRYEFQGV